MLTSEAQLRLFPEMPRYTQNDASSHLHQPTFLNVSIRFFFFILSWINEFLGAHNDKLSCRAEANGAGLLTVETSLDPKPIRGQSPAPG